MTLRSAPASAVILLLGAAPLVRAQELAPGPSVPLSAKPGPEADPLGRSPLPGDPSHRELTGHLFLPSHLVVDPFSCTALGVSLGLGGGTAFGRTVTLDPPSIVPDGRQYHYDGLGMGFDLDVRFIEWLSMRAALGLGAYTGNDGSSVLVVGTNVRANWELGLKGSLPVGEHFRFAVSADASYGPALNILLADGLVDALRQCRDQGICTIAPGQFLQTSDTVTFVAGLLGAWAPADWAGLTLNLNYLNPIKTGMAAYSKNGIKVAAAAELDALPLVRWLPLGMNVAYSYLGPLGTEGVSTTQDLALGLYYTGRKDMAVGLQADWRRGQLASALTSRSTLAWLDFKYYW